MDWNTILTSIAGSSVVAAGIGYVLKRSFDRTLDLHFDRIKEQYKASIQEDVRRQAFVYDKQFTVLRAALSSVYRLRNSLRYVLNQAEKRQALERDDFVRQFQKDSAALFELLYDERAVLPKHIFEIVHDLKIPLAAASNMMEVRTFANERFSSEEAEEIDVSIINYYRELDEGYLLLVHEVQKLLGIRSGDDDTQQIVGPERG